MVSGVRFYTIKDGWQKTIRLRISECGMDKHGAKSIKQSDQRIVV